MKSVDPRSLKNVSGRVSYLRDFIGFTNAEAVAIHASKPIVAPLVPGIVDAVYEKLLSFDITARSFLPRQTGYDGAAVPAGLDDLTRDHPQIKFRMRFLESYLVKLVTMDYEAPETWEYLDKVGIMHTGEIGFAHWRKKPGLRVEYIHIGILLGYVMDILLSAVMAHPELDTETKSAVLKAFNKVIWIQNDLFARHYVRELESTGKWGPSRLPTGQLLTGFVVAVGVLGLLWGFLWNGGGW